MRFSQSGWPGMVKTVSVGSVPGVLGTQRMLPRTGPEYTEGSLHGVEQGCLKP